jgi:Na+-driven multidrug efflux pump
MLAQQDPWTPAALVAVHVVTKLLGNVLLVANMGMGLAGAAWASVAAQWVTAAAVSVAVCQKRVRSLVFESDRPSELKVVHFPGGTEHIMASK